jgi:drug/metabolite transporter (DMT)-like permease
VGRKYRTAQRLMATADSLRNPTALLGACYVVLGAVGFSIKSVLIKLGYLDGVDATTLLALRMGFSLPLFLGMLLWTHRKGTPVRLTGADWRAVVVLGLIGYYLSSFLDFLGLQFISAGLERLILFIYPTLVVLLAAVWTRRPVQRREAAAMVLSYAGIALAFVREVGLDQANLPLGALLVFGSALSYALYLLGSGVVIARLGGTRFTANAMTISCVAVLLHFTLTHELAALRCPPAVYGWAALMALFSTVLPSFLVSAGIQLIGASRAALVAAIGPVITLLLARAVLGEPLTGHVLAGTLLVCLGTSLASGAKLPVKRMQK